MNMPRMIFAGATAVAVAMYTPINLADAAPRQLTKRAKSTLHLGSQDNNGMRINLFLKTLIW